MMAPSQLDKAMLKKSEKVDFAFEIHAPDLLDKKNKEGRRVHACMHASHAKSGPCSVVLRAKV